MTALKLISGKRPAKDALIRDWQHRQRQDARDCGETPKIIDIERRQSTKNSFQLWCQTYFPASFTLPWSENHYKAAARIEKAVLYGGLFAMAMPRGSGKTTICEWAAMWALFHAHHKYVILIGATEQKARERLKSIQVELTTNQLLLDDFPDVVYPIWHLGTAKRLSTYQHQYGVPTGMEWSTQHVVFPRILPAGSDSYCPTGGSIIQVAGITGGEIRGANHKTLDGSVIRPSLAICDDPQTRDSAKSPTQSETRSQTLAADVAYCAGPGQPISVIVPCTVIYQGDMAERITDRDLHPEYQGIRTKLVDNFPERQDLWDKYAEIYRDSLRNDGDMTPATAFYGENKDAMDFGAIVTWPERYAKNELSAIQHAMNLLIRDEAAFWSECQNEPMENLGASDVMATPAEILGKINDYERFICPKDTTVVTCFIDIQEKCLYYMTSAWQTGFSGQIIDYGVWPDQGNRRAFATAELRSTLDTVLPHIQIESQIYQGLKTLTGLLCNQSYVIDGGKQIHPERVLIDANWGQQTNTVYQFCRENRYPATILPSHGKYVGATSQPWSSWKRRKGEKVGTHWRIRPSEEWPVRHAIYDTNWWKTFVHQRLKAQIGSSGSIGIYGRAQNNRRLDNKYHVELADHLCAEIPIKAEVRERVVYEWKLRASHPDNHFLDCLVGSAVGASMCGIELEGSKIPKRREPKNPVNFRDAYMQNVRGNLK